MAQPDFERAGTRKQTRKRTTKLPLKVPFATTLRPKSRYSDLINFVPPAGVTPLPFARRDLKSLDAVDVDKKYESVNWDIFTRRFLDTRWDKVEFRYVTKKIREDTRVSDPEYRRREAIRDKPIEKLDHINKVIAHSYLDNHLTRANSDLQDASDSTPKNDSRREAETIKIYRAPNLGEEFVSREYRKRKTSQKHQKSPFSPQITHTKSSQLSSSKGIFDTIVSPKMRGHHRTSSNPDLLVIRDAECWVNQAKRSSLKLGKRSSSTVSLSPLAMSPLSPGGQRRTIGEGDFGGDLAFHWGKGAKKKVKKRKGMSVSSVVEEMGIKRNNSVLGTYLNHDGLVGPIGRKSGGRRVDIQKTLQFTKAQAPTITSLHRRSLSSSGKLKIKTRESMVG